MLSVLLYAYSLIMGTSDAALPWALKILMIALVTVAVFIYRKPFQHLFSAVGYGVIGSRERAEAEPGAAGTPPGANTRRRRDGGRSRVRRLPGGPVGPAQPGAGGPASAAGVATAGTAGALAGAAAAAGADGSGGSGGQAAQRLRPAERCRRPGGHGAGRHGLQDQSGQAGAGYGGQRPAATARAGPLRR